MNWAERAAGETLHAKRRENSDGFWSAGVSGRQLYGPARKEKTGGGQSSQDRSCPRKDTVEVIKKS
jgi:hypothetical protein